MRLFGNRTLLISIFAIFVWAPLHALAPILALALFKPAGVDISYRAAFLIHANRIPARYLPGGIWHTVGRVMDYHELGAPPRLLTAYVCVEHVLAVGVALVPGGLVVFSMRGWDAWGVAGLFVAVTSMVGLVVFFFVLNRWILSGLKVTKDVYLGLVLLYMVFWTGAATAFVLFLSAFDGVADGVSTMEIGGTYLFSWGIGFLAVFAPQGIGVFEAVMGQLLSTGVTFCGGAALIAGFRLVVLFADLIVWACSYCIRRPVGRAPTA